MQRGIIEHMVSTKLYKWVQLALVTLVPVLQGVTGDEVIMVYTDGNILTMSHAKGAGVTS
jgi:hypothetical protein